MDGKLRVAWQTPNGTSRECVGKITDVSESGFRLMLPYRVEPRSYLCLRLDKIGFKASACVRYCVRSGMDFATGLEFTGGAKFVVSEEAAVSVSQ